MYIFSKMSHTFSNRYLDLERMAFLVKQSHTYRNAEQRRQARNRKYCWKLWEKALAVGLFLAILFSFSGFAAQCQDVSQRVLRLHVLANSDSQEDQTLKLQVRDRILQESSGLLDGVTDLQEAEERVTQAMPQLLQAAQDEVAKRGYDYPVTMELTPTAFSTRVYGNVTLPAGTYEALQIKIGEAEGHNWWCVLFPSLCIPASEDSAQLEDVLTGEELEIVQGEGYEVRFKVLELIEDVENWVQGE